MVETVRHYSKHCLKGLCVLGTDSLANVHFIRIEYVLQPFNCWQDRFTILLEFILFCLKQGNARDAHQATIRYGSRFLKCIYLPERRNHCYFVVFGNIENVLRPIIHRVTYNPWATSLPRGTVGSLRPTFVLCFSELAINMCWGKFYADNIVNNMFWKIKCRTWIHTSLFSELLGDRYKLL